MFVGKAMFACLAKTKQETLKNHFLLLCLYAKRNTVLMLRHITIHARENAIREIEYHDIMMILFVVSFSPKTISSIHFRSIDRLIVRCFQKQVNVGSTAIR